MVFAVIAMGAMAWWGLHAYSAHDLAARKKFTLMAIEKRLEVFGLLAADAASAGDSNDSYPARKVREASAVLRDPDSLRAPYMAGAVLEWVDNGQLGFSGPYLAVWWFQDGIVRTLILSDGQNEHVINVSTPKWMESIEGANPDADRSVERNMRIRCQMGDRYEVHGSTPRDLIIFLPRTCLQSPPSVAVCDDAGHISNLAVVEIARDFSAKISANGQGKLPEKDQVMTTTPRPLEFPPGQQRNSP
jgi:hypothetical protein